MKPKPKPYDISPIPNSVAGEPALAYAYTQDYDVEVASIEKFPEGVDATTPFVITQSGQKWWGIDLETAEDLEVIVAGIENGTRNTIPLEEVRRERKERIGKLELRIKQEENV